MAWAERYGKQGKWRARYTKPDGTTGSEPGFRTKRAAESWGNAEEEKMKGGDWADPKLLGTPFETWAEEWYEAQDLAETTMSNYRSTLDSMILPHWVGWGTGSIKPINIAGWTKKLRAEGYKPSSIATAHARMYTLMEDAVDNGYARKNPCDHKRKRGKRSDNAPTSSEEEVWTTPLGALLVAERCGVLGGRDEDFLFPLTIAYTGMRLGEAIGLEKRYARAKLHGLIRVEWQLVEVRGHFYRRPPKGDGRRDIQLPPFLVDLIADQIAAIDKNFCACDEPHDDRPREYTFLGPGSGHHRRSNYYRRQFTPAVEGMRPVRDGERAPVYVSYEESSWPGAPVVGRNSAGRAEAAWLPVEPGLTPHGLRHSHKTWMLEDHIPEIAQFERLGHTMGGIRGVYSHASDDMRQAILTGLQRRWEESLSARAAISPRSAVPLLDRLLREHQAAAHLKGSVAEIAKAG
ncbi:tyrosine-type recombinase/integrase [Actinomadura harenae]|uniref:Core-binding (CB) domain-containing protein n=1 Tax=Actinomadura harenae TaxID=2483351 RepID=A0A3M2LR31_9ACTN|nr:hypothetical protein [Actinomadura harenae]RMI39909.1 hypothetical protein EBO15_28505 [Actinomadura harenae]